ncbi:AraC family transcriptional regulator [uncultured Ruminococcus sp.]|uniref:helix-turn-helix domain-containing protein n=1 Tax=uncultured Ruminococcus sp. TaxID=165186 RepID=UPI0025EC94AE|nr:AraC family transcriptional regulator [uncultured Ruminococcus sp.]
MEHKISDDIVSKASRQIICTPSPSAKNTFFYVQEAGYAVKGEASVQHRNNLDSFLIAAVVGGFGELMVGDDTFHLIKGDCFFVDCCQPYYYKSSEAEPWDLLWIHFNGSTSQQYYDFFTSQSKAVFRPQFFDRVVSAITEIIDINDEKQPDAEILSSKLIVDLLTTALTVNQNDQQFDSALKQKLLSVHNYIDEHFAEDLSLEKLSSQFYISKYYLTREYKRIYGKTIFQHIITARINYGKKLLRFSDKTVEQIAHLCGFNDQSYFARQFKKSENLTCFAYRKKWRE